MSRHKLVKNLDLDDELDDYDGGEDYADGGAEEEMTESDKLQMQECSAKVRQVLSDEIPSITNKEIEDSLWHYYYDVDKTIAYLRNQRAPKKPKKTKSDKAAENINGHTSSRKTNGRSKSLFVFNTAPTDPFRINEMLDEAIQDLGSRDYSCTTSEAVTAPCSSFSVKEFFADSPWLNVPLDRRGEILIEPLYPRGGLLGGASATPAGGKMSKLAMLAAARKKKAAIEKENVGPVSQAVGTSSPPEQPTSTPSTRRQAANLKVKAEKQLSSASNEQDREALGDHEAKQPNHRPAEQHSNLTPSDTQPSPTDFQSYASIFAKAMLGEQTHSAAERHPPKLTFDLSNAVGKDILDSNAFTGPSPDDVVTAAQNSSKGQRGGNSTAKKANGTSQITNGVASLSVEESSRAKSKNLDVVAEYEKAKKKNAANFVVIGHVDHGKSTLMGRLLYDLKVIDTRTIDKYRKEAEKIGKSSFALAWVLDQTSEERSRGVTMDIATNRFETEKTKFTILDAPGHQDFIPNMIAGASQADFAVLVIDGSPNAFESGLRGQTKEHALLVRSMGVQRMVVAVNKLDLVDWSKERFDEIQQQTVAFLTVAGFQLKNLSFVPVSGLTGDNIVRRAEDEMASWYEGPTLVELLDTSEPVVRALQKPLRITVGDVFRGGVQNPLSVSGRIEAGSLQVGDAVVAMPSSEKAYIKGIEVDDEGSDWAVAGQIATLHLTDIDPVHLKTGDVLCAPNSPIQNITTFAVKILAFDHITPMSVDVHRGRLHAPGRVTQLVATLDKANGSVVKRKPKIIQPGSVARIKVEMDRAVPLESPTRVVLRANGETVGAGLLE